MSLLNRRPVHAAVVFVDDYVRGTLPEVSVVSGVRCTSVASMSTPVERLNAAWFLLIFAGPIGWIAIALASFSTNRSTLAGNLPITKEEFKAVQSASREGRAIAIAGLTIGVLDILANAYGDIPGAIDVLALLAAFGFIIFGAVQYARAEATWPEVRLDASRRWVTLVGVHPSFAAACEAMEDQHSSHSYQR